MQNSSFEKEKWVTVLMMVKVVGVLMVVKRTIRAGIVTS